MVSQAVAPQTGSVTEQAALQQLPVPFTPQAPELQESFALQAVPGVSTGKHAPAEHQAPLAQSLAVRQVVLQLLASAQAKLFGQATGVPSAQVPVPSQLLAVSMLPVQVVVPQVVVVVG